MSKIFESIVPEFVNEFNEKVLKADSIVIASHKSPDDDSISSALATYTYLVDYLKINETKIKVMCTGEINDRWKYFKYFEKINFVSDLLDKVNNTDLLILVDGNGLDRFSRRSEPKFEGFVICIDHHPLRDYKFDLHTVMKERASTSEIVYKLFYEKAELNKDICETILLGILGDTGNFRFISPGNSDVLSISERLVKEGNVNIDTLQGKYQKMNQLTFKSLIEIMKNSKIDSFGKWPLFMYSYISNSFVEENKITDNEISEAGAIFTSYLKGLEGVDWGFVVSPRTNDGTNSLSLRSAPGSVCVREVAERMKIGGGHDRSSGGKINIKNTDEAVEMMINWLKENEPTFS